LEGRLLGICQLLSFLCSHNIFDNDAGWEPVQLLLPPLLDGAKFADMCLLCLLPLLQPEFWPTGLGGRTPKGDWKGGFDAFANYFHQVAQQLAPCGSGKKILSGPGWGELLKPLAYCCLLI
jgi:hypothetical protein